MRHRCEYYLKFIIIASALSFSLPLKNAEAGSEPFLGEIALFATNFCPRGWMEADGQLLNISDNNALFSLFGTIYGGDGRTTFALPDMRGRAPIHHGAGPGLRERRQGEKGDPDQIQVSTGNQVLSVGTPHLVLRYCVAFLGVYPSRN